MSPSACVWLLVCKLGLGHEASGSRWCGILYKNAGNVLFFSLFWVWGRTGWVRGGVWQLALLGLGETWRVRRMKRILYLFLIFLSGFPWLEVGALLLPLMRLSQHYSIQRSLALVLCFGCNKIGSSLCEFVVRILGEWERRFLGPRLTYLCSLSLEMLFYFPSR